ncbi:carboxypeptidase regulatory-like domain-containing protein [Candidatus Poribacteria bacterium]|nr:carboxypeptidase regulatory-like domain-containing protein [Candidatus Poribacteria bacterium]
MKKTTRQQKRLPKNRAVISGVVTDEKVNPIANAHLRLFQNGNETLHTSTGEKGAYRLDIYPADGLYDLSATYDELGDWQLSISLCQTGCLFLPLTLKKAISISGRVTMLDDVTSHVAIVVQAIQIDNPQSSRINSKVVATTKSGTDGRYQFINLPAGHYFVRCQTRNGYVYYGQKKRRENWREDRNLSSNLQTEIEDGTTEVLPVEMGRTLSGIDFHFPPFKKGTWKTLTYLDGLINDRVFDIHEDSDGTLLFATNGGGVCRYDGKTFTRFGPFGGTVFAIERDSDGGLWFGTEGSGVYRYDGTTFQHFTVEDGLAHNTVCAIHCDKNGVVWFGTGCPWIDGKGICRYDRKGFVNFTVQDGLAHNTVCAIHCDTAGSIWFGTWNGGISRYDGNNFQNFSTKDGLGSNDVYAIHRDNAGLIWVSTHSKGVCYYDETGFQNFMTADSLGNDRVDAIAGDAAGGLWFGTYGGGASHYDGESFQNFTTRDGLGHYGICHICHDKAGRIWGGTLGGGVSHYDGMAWATLDTRDGLGGNRVLSIAQTPDGSLWFGTDGGATHYRRGLSKPKVQIVTVTTDAIYRDCAIT